MYTVWGVLKHRAVFVPLATAVFMWGDSRNQPWTTPPPTRSEMIRG